MGSPSRLALRSGGSSGRERWGSSTTLWTPREARELLLLPEVGAHTSLSLSRFLLEPPPPVSHTLEGCRGTGGLSFVRNLSFLRRHRPLRGQESVWGDTNLGQTCYKIESNWIIRTVPLGLTWAL